MLEMFFNDLFGTVTMRTIPHEIIAGQVPNTYPKSLKLWYKCTYKIFGLKSR